MCFQFFNTDIYAVIPCGVLKSTVVCIRSRREGGKEKQQVLTGGSIVNEWAICVL